MIRRQIQWIAVALFVALLIGVAVFVLFQTVWKDNGLNNGEEVFMVEPLTMDRIASISVTNEKGTYRLYRGEDNELYFEGAEYVLYNQNMIAYLRSVTANLSVSGEVEKPEEMEEYALTEDKCLCDFTVTSTDGNSYRVLVGEKLVGGDGYYARLFGDERVFVLGSALERCLFDDVRIYLSGQVATALSSEDYFDITTFSIEREGKTYVTIEKIPEAEVKESDLSTHRIIHPARYEPNTDLWLRIFKSLTTFVGDAVVEYDIVDRAPADFQKLMADYGFLAADKAAMHCRLSYLYHDVETEVYLSREDEETKKIYVYSPGFDVIASFDAATLGWTQYDLMEYTQIELFAHSILEVASVGLASDDTSAVFTLIHGEKDADLKVEANTGDKINVQDFRRFYSQILYVKNEGYADVPDELDESTKVTLTITMTDGAVYEYEFFRIASLQDYYRIDGEGVFYVNHDYVKKLKRDVACLLKGEPVEVVQYAEIG